MPNPLPTPVALPLPHAVPERYMDAISRQYLGEVYPFSPFPIATTAYQQVEPPRYNSALDAQHLQATPLLALTKLANHKGVYSSELP